MLVVVESEHRVHNQGLNMLSRVLPAVSAIAQLFSLLKICLDFVGMGRFIPSVSLYSNRQLASRRGASGGITDGRLKLGLATADIPSYRSPKSFVNIAQAIARCRQDARPTSHNSNRIAIAIF